MPVLLFHFCPRDDVTRLLLSTDYLDNLDYPPTVVLISLFLIASIGHLSRFNDPVDNRPSQRTLLLRKIIWFSRIRNLDCFYPAIHKASFFFKAFPCWHFPVSIFVSLWMSAADGMVCAIKLTSIQVFIMSGKTDIWWEFFFSNHQARHFSSGVSGKPIISRCLTGHRPLSLKIL